MDEVAYPTHFPGNIFVRHWDNYMTSDIKTVHIYETQSSDYLANISTAHPHHTIKYFAEYKNDIVKQFKISKEKN